LIPVVHQSDREKTEKQMLDRLVRKELRAETDGVTEMILGKNQVLGLLPVSKYKKPALESFEPSNLTLTEQHQQLSMPFDQDFEKLDLDIKAKLQSIADADYETFRLLQNNELPADETRMYLQIKARKGSASHLFTKTQKSSATDSDLS